ncbi:hypothetical protein E2C01_063423 [Portunus trituberculatus]|uniref:Uncharacterized protein n=1 Tax=Portunus trituberculatus TaxID=210409 RepID=A0A5B7HIX5_PORTR|nr:hypothetical protein [Portunus trituberculatus]
MDVPLPTTTPVSQKKMSWKCLAHLRMRWSPIHCQTHEESGQDLLSILRMCEQHVILDHHV